MRILRKDVEEAGFLPRFYGVAYSDVLSQSFVCYPVPLNILVNWCRRLWWRVKCPSVPEMEERLREAYRRGVHRGWHARGQRILQDLEDGNT